MTKAFGITAAVLALTIVASPSLGAACHDAKGKFIKCPPAASAAAPAKAAKCKDAKGKFAKCSAPGAKPIK